VVTGDPEQYISISYVERQNLSLRMGSQRFWFVRALAVFDVVALLRIENWTRPDCYRDNELIAVIVMANRCRADVVAPLIDKLVGMIPKL
jgi:hypothetical protein